MPYLSQPLAVPLIPVPRFSSVPIFVDQCKDFGFDLGFAFAFPVTCRRSRRAVDGLLPVASLFPARFRTAYFNSEHLFASHGSRPLKNQILFSITYAFPRLRHEMCNFTARGYVCLLIGGNHALILARYPVCAAPAAEDARLHPGSSYYARSWHWRNHGNLHSGQLGAASIPSLRAVGQTGKGVGQV